MHNCIAELTWATISILELLVEISSVFVEALLHLIGFSVVLTVTTFAAYIRLQMLIVFGFCSTCARCWICYVLIFS